MSQARLDRLLDLAAQDAELGDWLEAGVRRWLLGDALDSALQLDHPNARRARNNALCAAAAHLSAAFPDLSDWELAELLADEINRFETRLRSSAPADSAPWIEEIAKAFQQRCRQRRSARRIWDIIRTD